MGGSVRAVRLLHQATLVVAVVVLDPQQCVPEGRAMAASRGLPLLLVLAALLVGLASASSFISDGVFQAGAGSTTGRTLLQAKRGTFPCSSPPPSLLAEPHALMLACWFRSLIWNLRRLGWGLGVRLHAPLRCVGCRFPETSRADATSAVVSSDQRSFNCRR